jgi:hypothetical protein
MTMEEFEHHFSFAMEVCAASAGLVAIVIKYDVMRSIYRVVRGRANSADEAAALEAFQGDGGGLAQHAARAAAGALTGHGHAREAQRLNALRREAANGSRSVSPSHAV